jgi:hypothetical protein
MSSSFDNNLNIKNKKDFSLYLYDINKNNLRRKIYLHILKEEEKDYFCIYSFDKKYVKNIQITKKIISELIPELEYLGWKCKLAYGDTGLFIYSTPDPPINWWG